MSAFSYLVPQLNNKIIKDAQQMTIYEFYIAVEAASSHSLLVREGEEEREELHQQLGLQGDDNHPWVGLSHPKAGCRVFLSL